MASLDSQLGISTKIINIEYTFKLLYYSNQYIYKTK